MDISNAHNLNQDITVPKTFGIRVRLRPGESFTRIIGADWERTHWYVTEHERDRVLADMASEHLYSRRGDRPTLIFEPIDRDAD